MKLKILLFGLALTLTNTIYTQCVQENPNPDYINNFDWENGQTMPINTYCQPDTQTINPFYSSQTELLPFTLIKDFKQDDGWEAISYNLGYDNNNQPLSVRPQYGYIMLYNKYRGILRVLLCWCRDVDARTASLTLEFLPGFETNLLDMGEAEKSLLSKHKSGTSITTAFKFFNNRLNWGYADFKMNYDPCTCSMSDVSRLRLYSNFVENTEITLSGTINESLKDQSGGLDAKGAFWSGRDEIESKLIKAYKGVNSFKIHYKNIYRDLKDKESITNSINGISDALKTNDFLKEGLSEAPYVAETVKYISGLFSGGGGSQAPMKLVPVVVETSVDVKGTMNFGGVKHDYSIGLPGSEKSNEFPGIVGGQPLYDKTMGIFSLIDEPKMYYSDNTVRAFPSGSFLPNDSYTYRNYKFDGSALRYKINPDSNYELQDAEFMVVAEYEKPSIKYLDVVKKFTTPFYVNPADDYDTENGLSFDVREDAGNYGNFNKTKVGNCVDRENFIFQNAFPVIGSKYFKNDYSFRYLHTFNKDKAKEHEIQFINFRKFQVNLNGHMKIPRIKNLKLKIILNLRRTDNANAQNYLYVVTYPIKLIKAPNGYNMSGSNYAQDAKLYKDNPQGGRINKFVPISDEELNEVCQSTVYRLNRLGSAARLIKPALANEGLDTNTIIVSPNPFSNFVEIKAKNNVLISLTDLNGRVLRSFNTEERGVNAENINNKFQGLEKESTVKLNLSNLNKGIYLVNYIDNSGKKRVAKIVKK